MLEVNKLSFSYNKQDKILHDISFNVEEGEILCILGPNGCGKTTLLKSLCKITDFEGNIYIDGENIKNKDRIYISKKIAFMSQMSDIYFDYNVYDTVMLGRYSNFADKLFLMPKEEDKKIVLNYIDKLNLNHLKNKSIKEISGGELQRVFLAMIFSQNPNIILLDEPTNHLDINSQIELINNLKEWVHNNKKKSLIAVLHDISTALNFADKILILKEGRKEYFGEVKNFDINILNEIYNINLKKYMKSLLEIWK
ncbi:ABC transporter ATP-binding protein [Brachyspira alvinipulli]|uniref:ABC transporter ATP-binding protein n=1 Tax=Brachyspira alvinipulli TaxID=84379 RepID=UPI000485895D|nr:ABC transporter ATP-binding protein [Brachyspira alvinipulli]